MILYAAGSKKRLHFGSMPPPGPPFSRQARQQSTEQQQQKGLHCVNIANVILVCDKCINAKMHISNTRRTMHKQNWYPFRVAGLLIIADHRPKEGEPRASPTAKQKKTVGNRKHVRTEGYTNKRERKNRNDRRAGKTRLIW